MEKFSFGIEEKSAQFPNINFRVADFMAHDTGAEQFDCIVSIATFHHLPKEEALLKMKRALKVNGVMLLLDLFQADGILDTLRSGLALPMSMGLRVFNGSGPIASQEVRDAWARHGLHDSYLTLDQVRDVCCNLLPGAEVRRHLFWRYSVIWKKVL